VPANAASMLQSTSMLTAIEARNFKCFGANGINLDLNPLTLLVGPNGSGKSSALDAIALFAQTAAAVTAAAMGATGGFKWQGIWADLGNDGRFAFRGTNLASPMVLGLSVSGGESISRWLRDQGVGEETLSIPEKIKYAVKYSPKLGLSEHGIYLDGSLVAVRTTVAPQKGPAAGRYQDVLELPNVPGLEKVQLNLIQSPACVLSPILFSASPSSGVPANTYSHLNNRLSMVSHFLTYMGSILAAKTFIVGAERSPKDAEMKLEPGPLRVGRRGEKTLAVLSAMFARVDYGPQADRIRHWAGVFGLERLAGGWTGGPLLQAGYYDSNSETTLPIRYSGFGSQQILPVIVQLFAAPPGSLIMIEEPEISLHPEAQVSLVRMFADAIAYGQQLIVTTHSETLLLALQQLRATKGLSPGDVAVYHFSRDETGATAARLPLDENWYIKGWVPSFAAVEERLLKEWGAKLRANTEAER